MKRSTPAIGSVVALIAAVVGCGEEPQRLDATVETPGYANDASGEHPLRASND
jgi:hypothetical protein